MHPNCEKFVLQQLPSVRAMLVKDLMTRYKLTQTETARLTGITQAAVSQYMRSLRGRKITRNKRAVSEVKRISDLLMQKKATKKDLPNRFCKICRIINK